MISLWNDEKHLSSAVIYARVRWKDVFQSSSKVKGFRVLIDPYLSKKFSVLALMQLMLNEIKSEL
jgi:hypothetical protein